jgi:glucosamine-phosphate N-acetyltransferase
MLENNILFRPVVREDLDQLFPLLEQLTGMDYHNRDKDECWELFNTNTAINSIVGVIDNKIVTYGSIIIENKIHGSISGHIEDIVVDQDFRGQNIGIELINELVKIGETKGCYRITLFCKDHLVDFYSKNGFAVNNLTMKKFIK